MKSFIVFAAIAALSAGTASAQVVLGTGSWSGSESGAVASGSSGAGTFGGIAAASNETEMNLSSSGWAVGGTTGGLSGSASGTTANGSVSNTSGALEFGFGAAGASGGYTAGNGSGSGAFGGFGIMF